MKTIKQAFVTLFAIVGIFAATILCAILMCVIAILIPPACLIMMLLGHDITVKWSK